MLQSIADRSGLDLSALTSQLSEYKKSFAQVVALHHKNDSLNAEMSQLLDKVTALVGKVQEDIQARQFELQMEGENLSAAEMNLLSLTRDARNLALMLKNSMQQFLLTGDPAVIEKFDTFLKEKGMMSLSGLQQFSTATGRSEYVSTANEFRKGIETGAKLLHQSKDLFLEEQTTVKSLDVIGGNLKSAAEVLLQKSAEIMKQAKSQAIIYIISITLVGAILFLLVSLLIIRSITKPLAKAIGLATTIRDGDLSQRLHLKTADEVGQLCAALDRMADSLESKAAIAQKIAEGDLSMQVPLESDKDTLGKAFQQMVASLNQLISRIYVAGEQIAAGSGEISSASQDLSHGATTSASSLEEITSSMAELSSQTKLNAENANQANNLANETKSAAVRGTEQMDEMVQAMVGINDAGQNISKIIKVIDEIAFQTNLLALNAAVEAARAGQHGKGFAVVAEEVRNLAARSAKAAQETSELIEGSVSKTEKGTEVASRTEKVLEEIAVSVTKVTDLVQEISTASNEQAQGISEVTQGLGQIDQVTQQNTAAAEQSAAAAEELSGQAAELQHMLSGFSLQSSHSPVDRFEPVEAAPEQADNGWQELSMKNA
ncbi:MAG: HAMP domain-containing protein [Deltaproteobacteria bacterium]|nr:HAMP domain-containing protein [Deltaproteobacteria bacterium]